MRSKYRQQGLGRTRVQGFDPVRYAPHEMRVQVLERDGYRCRYCDFGLTLRTAMIDHVVPWKDHGATQVTNPVTSCSLCNKAKGNKKGIRPRHLGKKPSDQFKAKQPYIKREYVTVPEYQTPCQHKQSPNCLRQRCLEERHIPFAVEGDARAVTVLKSPAPVSSWGAMASTILEKPPKRKTRKQRRAARLERRALMEEKYG